MKKIAVVIVGVCCAAICAAQSGGSGQKGEAVSSALVSARGNISEAIGSREAMAKVMKTLSSAEQKQFVADVNAAIAALPASIEEKAAKYLNANHAALASAKKENLVALIAEVFATVSPEALTVLNERFATDLFSRSANKEKPTTDQEFEKAALDIMKTVNERTSQVDNGEVRSGFAMLMLVRASGGSPADLADKLIATIADPTARDLAKNEWLGAALGKDGKEPNYDSMMASSSIARRPDLEYVLVSAGPQFVDAILDDILVNYSDSLTASRMRTPMLDAIENRLIHQAPNMGADFLGAAGAAGNGLGALVERDAMRPTPLNQNPLNQQQQQPDPGPIVYNGQRIY